MSQQLLDWAKKALEMLNDNHHLVADNEKHAYVMLHFEAIEAGKALLEQPAPVQRKLVGDSRFESWFSEDFDPKSKGTKQQMREAYEAGMNDDAATPPAQPAVPEQQKQELAEIWFAEDWAITKAIGMLYDYERLLSITAAPTQGETK
jgi:hypothetical protein